MLTEKSDQEIKLRIIKRYGDLDIILSFFTIKFWSRIIKKDKLIWFELGQGYLGFVAAMFANSVGVFFGLRPGSGTMGFILTSSTALLILIFNSTKMIFLVKPFVFLGAPAIPFFVIKYERYDLVFEHIHSQGLLIFLSVYLLFALLHTVTIYIGKGNRQITKRGDSWLYILIFKRTLVVSEFFVQAFLEPGLTVAIGFGFWFSGDETLAIFLWMGAACLCIQEVLDEANHAKNRPLVRQ